VSISVQTLHDILIALSATVGVAVALSIMVTMAGVLFERGKARANKPAVAAVPAQHPTQTDDARELVLR